MTVSRLRVVQTSPSPISRGAPVRAFFSLVLIRYKDLPQSQSQVARMAVAPHCAAHELYELLRRRGTRFSWDRLLLSSIAARAEVTRVSLAPLDVDAQKIIAHPHLPSSRFSLAQSSRALRAVLGLVKAARIVLIAGRLLRSSRALAQRAALNKGRERFRCRFVASVARLTQRL